MKLVHQISLMLLAAVLLTVLAMGAIVAFSLERGFVDYLNLRQLTHLDAIETRLKLAAKTNGSLEYLRHDGAAWGTIIKGAEAPSPAASAGEPPPRRTPYTTRTDAKRVADDRPPPPSMGEPLPDDEPADDRPPPDRLPGQTPNHVPAFGGRPAQGNLDPLNLGPRFHLYDANHQPMHPNTPVPPPDSGDPIEREIRVGDTIVGYLKYTPVLRSATKEDSIFLQHQLKNIGLAGAVLLVLALLTAPLMARRWARPINDISDATARIAKGAFDVRLPEKREDEIGALMKNVNAMAVSLGGLEAARKRWIAEIAHELRTPLSVLRGEIEGLQDGVRQYNTGALVSLGEETAHLTKLVNDLHLLSLADVGSLPCTMLEVDAVALTQRLINRFLPRAEQRGLVLTLDAPETAIALVADAGRIEQLLTNLIENSLRYTNPSGRVNVRLAAQDQNLLLMIEDSPPGVAAADCEKLFEPLYRADRARSRANGGSGLGLAICRAIVRAHGGQIFARPSVVGGLQITAILPLVATAS